MIYRRKFRSEILILLLFIISIAPAEFVFAQTSQLIWSEPNNLSQSGATLEPRMVQTFGGTVFVIWQDEIANSFFYTKGNGEEWDIPAAIEVPFGTRVYELSLGPDDPTPLYSPHLVVDNDDNIHAFWLDGEGSLFYSWVEATNFSNFALWEPRQLVAEQVTQFAPAVDEDNRVHVVYILSRSSEELPAGVYYRQFSSEVQAVNTEGETAVSSISWSVPMMLYTSLYYRSNSGASLDLLVEQVNEVSYLYAVWDNQSLDKLFFRRSKDGGQQWDDLTEIDKREEDDDPEGLGPSRIQLSAYRENVLLVWQASHGSLFCSLYYRWSEDAGGEWKARESLLAEQQTCPDQRLLIDTESEVQILSVRFGEVTSFLAWNNGVWTEPMVQTELAGFDDLRTNRRINFFWQDLIAIDSDTLLVIGRDPTQNNDVWQLNRPLGDVNDWFPPPSLWSPAQVVTESETNIANMTMASDNVGNIHLAWTQLASLTDDRSTIYYSRWDGEQWSRPISILASPTGNQVLEPDIATTPNGRILIVWQNENGEMFISQALNQRPELPQEWSAPLPIIIPGTATSAPYLVVNVDNLIYVCFAITLNEGRGIYLVYSDDNARSWSEPILVFDAIEADWSMLDEPKMIIHRDKLSVIWTRLTLPPHEEPLGLYSTISVDGGKTWSEAEMVVEASVQWSAIEGIADGLSHRLWREHRGNESIYWHQISFDGGITWQPEQRISGLELVAGSSASSIDANGRLHLITIEDRFLVHNLWYNGQWIKGERLDIRKGKIANNQDVVVSISSRGDLVSAYFGEVFEPTTETTFNMILSTHQQLESIGIISTPLPTSTPLPIAPPTFNSNITPQPTGTLLPLPNLPITPTLQFEEDQYKEANSESLIPKSGVGLILLSVAPVVFLILLSIIIRTRWLSRR